MYHGVQWRSCPRRSKAFASAVSRDVFEKREVYCVIRISIARLGSFCAPLLPKQLAGMAFRAADRSLKNEASSHSISPHTNAGPITARSFTRGFRFTASERLSHSQNVRLNDITRAKHRLFFAWAMQQPHYFFIKRSPKSVTKSTIQESQAKKTKTTVRFF